MPPSDSKEQSNSKKDSGKKKDRAAEIADTFEWLITAFILAFVFRAFVMEAFRIPTGSMADTLKGAHFRLRCVQCGYRYDHWFDPGAHTNSSGRTLHKDTIPGASVSPPRTRCPNCGYYPSTSEKMVVANGDRILVLKCIYQFFEPKRWDVIVFKNPLGPRINFIKRLIALPEDELEIIDGDVYIDGQISRKPPNVQNELWMPIYDNDYQPVKPNDPNFNLAGTKKWRQPFKNNRASQWVTTDHNNPTLFSLDSPADQINAMIYDSSVGNDFRATYAYNNVGHYRQRPYCSDLMVRFYSRPASVAGRIGIDLSKYGTSYKAWIDLAGKMVIAKVSEEKERVLVSEPIEPPAVDKWVLVKFANVDHQLVFEFGGKKISHDLGRKPEDAGQRKTNIEPQAQIFGSGKLTLSHVAIFRDTHYTSTNRPNWASEGHPYQLGKNEFFVLGDNSPNSHDCRLWNQLGTANKGSSAYPEGYRRGIVPRDYLVGKALFVYWPSGFKPFAKFPIAAIPNVGRMRFIYGGSNNIE